MSQANASLRVLLLSAVGTRTNPYIGLLTDGLTAAGAQVSLARALAPADLFGAQHPDVIHLHWLDHFGLPEPVVWRAPRRPGVLGLPRRAAGRFVVAAGNLPVVYLIRRGRRLVRLLSDLRRFQAAGGRVAYTVHNLDPHDGAANVADRWGTAALMRQADLVHVHDASTAEAVAGRYRRRTGVAVIPHGHYISSYPNTIGRAEARARLGLPAEAFLYVTLGLMRPYKGLEELLPAFRALAAPDALLLLAGRPESARYAATLAGLAAGDPRVRLTSCFVPPDEVQLYLNAADVSVLPYRQITTSGAALLSFSFGLPVIAPAIGAFPDLVTGRRGILYDPADCDGLGRALARARAIDWQGARAEVLAWVAQFDWGEVGRRMVAAYRELELRR